MKGTNRLNILLSKRISTRHCQQVFSYSSIQRITIPELHEANTAAKSGKYTVASGLYSRVLQIIDSVSSIARQNSINHDYIQASMKFAACASLEGKNADASKAIQRAESKTKDLGEYTKFSHFLTCVTDQKAKSKQQKNDVLQQIILAVSKLKGAQTDKVQWKHIPVLGQISQDLNNNLDYRKALISLVERSPKSEKSDQARESIKKLTQLNPSTELELLSHMGTILVNKPVLKTGDKQLINNRVNSILKQYENTRPQQVFKALLDIIMSLIAENHYMSAEGMIGFVKTEESGIMRTDSQDRNLINNIYRMLVTRANNQAFDQGWTKQKQVKFGDLVISRIIKAPLLGHSVSNLIC